MKSLINYIKEALINSKINNNGDIIDNFVELINDWKTIQPILADKQKLTEIYANIISDPSQMAKLYWDVLEDMDLWALNETEITLDKKTIDNINSMNMTKNELMKLPYIQEFIEAFEKISRRKIKF